MAGWRDTEGRTARQRTQERGAADRARLVEDMRHRPITLLRGVAGFVFILLLVLALLVTLR